MFKQMPFQTLALGLLLACLLVQPLNRASADPLPHGSGGQTPGKEAAHADRHQQMMKELGLSPEQGQKVKSVMEQGRAQSKALREQLKAKRQAMMQYLQNPKATESGARSLNGDINDLQRQLSEIRLKTWFNLRAHLNPEQLQKLQAIKAKQWAQHGASGRHPHPPDEY